MSKRAHRQQPSKPKSLAPSIADDIRDVLARAGSQSLTPHEKVAVANAKLYVQAHPLEFRPAKPPTFPTAPTPEQASKGEYHRKPEAGGVYSHRLKRVFESLSKHYPDAVLLALTKFYEDAESHARCGPVVVNLERSGGGSGDKLGGLGNVQERVRLQYARHKRVVACLREIDEEFIEVLRWLVVEVRKHSDERMPNVAEVGKRLVPTIIDRATTRGISIGYLKAVAQVLIHLYRRDRLNYGDEYRRNYDEFSHYDEA